VPLSVPPAGIIDPVQVLAAAALFTAAATFCRHAGYTQPQKINSDPFPVQFHNVYFVKIGIFSWNHDVKL